MPIPTYDMLLRPILELANLEDTTRRSATASVIVSMGLSEDEQKETIPSGGATTIGNRAGWAMSHLTKAGLISKVAKFTYRSTTKGSNYLSEHKGPITPSDLREIEGFLAAWEQGTKKKAESKGPIEHSQESENASSQSTPEEQIDNAVNTLGERLQDELLEQLSSVDPFRFEQIVIDLLFSMGYGGSREEAAQVTKKSNDEGIDGIINEDRLGLDVIYVQAKRWKDTVGRKEIQSFVGALAGKQATKGVFITTSRFAATADHYAASVNQKVILIDGARLTDLMIEYGIGVSTNRTVSIKRIDSDYFED